LTLQANPGTLAPGTYKTTLTIAGDSGQSVSLDVYMTVSQTAQTLVLPQTGLKFTTVAGGGAPLPQQFSVFNGGSGSLSWTATPIILAGAADGSSWLTLSPASGTVAGSTPGTSTVTAGINPAALTGSATSMLAAGEYFARIRVDAPGAANTPQFLTVILDVLATDPGPDVEPGGLIFSGVAGTSPSSQSVSILNLSPITTTFTSGRTTTDGQSWLMPVPTAGTAVTGQATQVVVQPDFTNLAPGVYLGTVNLVFGQGAQAPTRTINVVSIVNPPSGVTALDRQAGFQPQALDCTKFVVVLLKPSAGFSVNAGSKQTIQATIKDGCSNPVMSQTPNIHVNVVLSTTDSAPDMTYDPPSGTWTTQWTPSALSNSVTVTLIAAATSGSGGAHATGTVVGGKNPLINLITHAASFVKDVPLAPGSLITLKGSNLSDGTGNASDVPLPLVWFNSQTDLNSHYLPILYGGHLLPQDPPDQLNVQVPYDVPVNVGYQITVQLENMPSQTSNLLIAEAQPGIFTLSADGNGQGWVFKNDMVTVATADTPAAQGETITILCTGLGAVVGQTTGDTSNITAGVPTPTDQLYVTTHPVSVSIGGQNAQVLTAALAPLEFGVYQVKAVVPMGVSGVALPVTVTVGGQAVGAPQTSRVVTMAVQ
jgi:uncharacterized protein (TIGR03437 family)